MKRNTEGVKQQSTPSSLSSDLSELYQLKQEQMVDDNDMKYKIIQLSIEEGKLKC